MATQCKSCGSGGLEVLTHSINDGPMEMIQNNQYDALGQLVSKRVGGDINLDDSGYQKIDYRYNIRGWLTDINNFLDLQETPGLYPDLFAFHINYDQVYDIQGDYTGIVEGLYNGNISETYWLSSTDNTIRKYGYRYDKLNRLKDAYFQQPASMDHNCQSYNEHLSYDKNGNILTLNRHSRLENFPAAVEIDDLEYFYQGNQLTKVTDLSGYPQGFKDDSDGTNDDDDDYRYDAFGNMYRDENKQIVFISYNHLNLPVEILFENGSTIHYLYNAAGQKLRKIVSDIATSGVSTTEYLDGFQYNNSILQFFSHPEGYVLNTPDRNGDPSFDYVYQYKDHLGNIRMNFVFDPGDGSSSLPQLKILEENHYYPFGLKHENYNVTKKKMKWESELIGGEEMELKRVRQVPNSGYQYKYNGKEWQEELGLNVYDYGARFYMPDIGRMGSMDALSEKYYPISPNTYALNNPMYFVDPDGNYIEIYFKHGDREYSERYEYVKDRDYSKMSGFKADAYKALDALYNASTIDIDGEQVNVMQTLMDSSKELSVAQGDTEKSSMFSPGKSYKNRNETSSLYYNDIGTIYFNNKQGTLYDDVNDTSSDVLIDLLNKNKLPKTAKVNSPTSDLGHEMIHGFNFLTSKNNEYRNRTRSGPVNFGPIKFKNQEEARATSLSSQINIQLGEHPRNNHKGAGVNTNGVLSTEIIKP